jgi:tetratricopeptide (TPR) repeat protein
MAKKRVSRSRKRDLDAPDEFITFWAKLFEFAKENKVKLSCALGFFVLLIVVIAVMAFLSNKAENKSFALLQEGMDKYQSILKDSGPEKACLDVENDFQSIIDKYPGKEGGKLAKLFFGNMCYNAGYYDKAIELYKKSLQDFSDNPFLKNLVLGSLGYSYKGKKDCNAAVKYFEMVASMPDNSIKDEALFNLGGLYAEMGDSAMSINSYKKIMSDHPDSIYINIVKERLGG